MQTSRRVHQIAKLETQRQQVAARAKRTDKRIADRLRQLQAEEARAERKRETRRKIVIGAIVRGAQMSETDISLGWLEAQIHALKRLDDHALGVLLLHVAFGGRQRAARHAPGDGLSTIGWLRATLRPTP